VSQTSSDEERRQQAIADYRIGDAASEPVFNHLAELTARALNVPIALITVLRTERQIFSGACGIGGDGTERGLAFCNHTVRQADVFEVPDTHADPLFADHPMVTGEPHIRFYAGAPLRAHGIAIGSLCLVDSQPRSLTTEERQKLKMFARSVEEMMELRVGSLLYAEQKAQLEEQRNLLRATIDAVEEGIGLFDRDLRLAVWNERFFQLLDFGPEFQEVGIHGADLLGEAARRGYLGAGELQSIVDDLLTSLRTVPRRELQLRLPEDRVLEATRATLPDGRSVLTLEDISQRHAMGRLKDQFVSTVSHELRTPLTSIRGSLALLAHSQRKSMDERSRKLLDMATSNAERLSLLIDDILDIEKLSSGAIEYRAEQADLRELVGQSVEQNRPFAATYQVELADRSAAEALPLLGDPVRVQQAITNLISNAVKFSPMGGTVEVAAERKGKIGRVTVSDRGPGIPVEFRPRLFKRFSQAGRKHQQGRSGTGLGLAITRAIIERHGGTISFESTIGEGTSFWFELPLSEERQ
jgi:signal transduction histidine kinase